MPEWGEVANFAMFFAKEFNVNYVNGQIRDDSSDTKSIEDFFKSSTLTSTPTMSTTPVDPLREFKATNHDVKIEVDPNRTTVLTSVAIAPPKESNTGDGTITNLTLNGRDEFLKALPLTVVSVENYGKKMIIKFARGGGLMFAFGMDGSLTLQRRVNTRLVLTFKQQQQLDDSTLVGNSTSRDLNLCKDLCYEFSRGISCWVHYFPTCQELNLNLKEMSQYEASKIGFSDFCELIQQSSKQALGNFLVDQKKMCGIGNYLRAEIIYKARIDWDRQCGTLQHYQLKNLYKSMKMFLKKTRECGGCSIQDYYVNGVKGNYIPYVYGETLTNDKYQFKVDKYSTSGQTMHFVSGIEEGGKKPYSPSLLDYEGRTRKSAKKL